MTYNNQLLDKVEENVMICHGEQINFLPISKAEVNSYLLGIDKSQYFARTNFNNVLSFTTWK